jgi:hypothetical protein
MKKIFLGFLLLVISGITFAQSGSNTEATLINSFLSTPEYARVEKRVNELGSVDLENSRVAYVDEDVSKPTLYLIIKSQTGIIKGVINVVPLPIKAKTILPNNDKYFMQLVDYSNYDVTSKTGLIKTLDLNYENYLSAEITVNNQNVSSFQVYQIPSDILARHPADTNGNGNVSYGECMSFMHNACGGASSCGLMCSIINVASTITPIGNQCNISMGAACIYLSIKY